MYIGYVGKDEFNINTQVDSFLYRARQHGLQIEVCYHPEGHHNSTSAQQFIPSVISWLDKQLAAYKPKSDTGAVLPGSLHKP
jgi:S-formylglutathione hydrolase FrmB